MHRRHDLEERVADRGEAALLLGAHVADGGRARFYTVVSRDTNDTEYAQRRQRFLAEHGVEDLVGYVLRDGRTPEGVGLDRLVGRRERALEADDAHIARSLGARVVVPGDEEWPVEVDQLQAPPWCLWVRGPLRLEEVPGRSVAVVGAGIVGASVAFR